MHSEDEDTEDTYCETCGYFVDKDKLARHLNMWENKEEDKHLEMENSNPVQDIPEQNDSDKDVPNKKLPNSIILTILQGVYDDSSPLANLRGIPHVIQIIVQHVKEYWKSHIQVGMFKVDGNKRHYIPHIGQFAIKLDEQSVYSWHGQEKVIFPEPSDININMMPFIMAKSFEESFLPEYLRSYFDKLIFEGILENRKDIMEEEMGKVCYLSIQESWCEENSSQRRPGLHTESPGKFLVNDNENTKEIVDGNVLFKEIENIELTADKDHKMEEQKEKQEYLRQGDGSSKKFYGMNIYFKSVLDKCSQKCLKWGEKVSKRNKNAQFANKQEYLRQGDGSSKKFYGIHGWGISMGFLQGGIYMASTVKNSCKLWDCQILPDEGEEGDIIGQHGDIEHLRNYLPEGHPMEENVMYWITDRTPHESLPLEKRTYRQWFRLVTSGVSLWFQDHSTPNPTGIVPDPTLTKIIKGSKFDVKSLTVA